MGLDCFQLKIICVAKGPILGQFVLNPSSDPDRAEGRGPWVRTKAAPGVPGQEPGQDGLSRAGGEGLELQTALTSFVGEPGGRDRVVAGGR